MPLDNKYMQNYTPVTAQGIAATDTKKVLSEYSTFQGFRKEGAPPIFKIENDKLHNFRLLPRLVSLDGPINHFLYPVAIHYFKHVPGSCVCPAKVHGKCPSCEENKYIAFAADGPKDTKAAQTYRVSASFAGYGIDFDELSAGVKMAIFTPNVKECIDKAIFNQATGATLDIAHPVTGQNMVFKKEKTNKKFDNGTEIYQVNSISLANPAPLPDEFVNQWLEYVYSNPVESWFIVPTPEQVAEIAQITPESRQQARVGFSTMAANLLGQQAAMQNPVGQPPAAPPLVPQAAPAPPPQAAPAPVPAQETVNNGVPMQPPPPPANLQPTAPPPTSTEEKSQTIAEKMRLKKEALEREKAAKAGK